MADQVPSPMHQALSDLYSRIQQDQATMADALKDTCQRMAGSQTWIGYAADSWNTDLTGHSSSLSGSINATVADVASALASTPATCTMQEAHLENLVLSGRLQ